jgi:hypothetical protein
MITTESHRTLINPGDLVIHHGTAAYTDHANVDGSMGTVLSVKDFSGSLPVALVAFGEKKHWVWVTNLKPLDEK